MRSLLRVFSGCGAIRAWSVRAVVALVGGLLLLAPASALGATTIDATAGQPFSGAVAQVSCSVEGATINWGDGTATSPGTQSNGNVDGTHTYESPGTYNGTVTYQCPNADKTTVDFTADVTTATTTTLTSSQNPSAPGAQVTFTATVSPVPDGGYVEFTDNGLPAGAGGSEIPGCAATVVSAGVATCAPDPAFTPGAYSIVATYSGDANYAGSVSATLTQTIEGSPTTTTLTDSDGLASVVDSSDDFAATVTPVPDGGTVAFTDDGVTIPGCSAIAVSTTSGIANCQDNFAFSSQGYHTIVATYSGDANYAASSDTVTVAVGPFATTTTLTSSKDSVPVGATVVFTATVSPTPNNPGVLLSDFVYFTDNGLTIDNGGSPVECAQDSPIRGLVPLAGGSVATCTATAYTRGYYSIVAQYASGDPTYDDSTSSLLFLSVGVPSPGIMAGEVFVNLRDWLMLEDEVSGPGVVKGTAIAKLAASTRALTARAADSGHAHDGASRIGQIVYGSGRVTVTRAGRVALTIKPSALGLAALKKHHSLRLTVTVKFTPKGSKKAVTRSEHVTATYKHSTKSKTTSGK
jgi:hypothetical protein